MTAPQLRAGVRVHIPAHGVAGLVATFTGDAPNRLINVELIDGTIMPVREADVVITDGPAPAEPPPPAPGKAIDLVVFCRDLARRTKGMTTDEACALNQLALAHLTLLGRRP